MDPQHWSTVLIPRLLTRGFIDTGTGISSGYWFLKAHLEQKSTFFYIIVCILYVKWGGFWPSCGIQYFVYRYSSSRNGPTKSFGFGSQAWRKVIHIAHSSSTVPNVRKNQGCGSGYGTGSELDPYSIGSVDPDLDPYSESGSGSRRAKMTQQSRQ